VYRDVKDLVASGVPVTGEAGVGYALARRIDLPPLMFDRMELEALAVGLRFAQAFGDERLRAAAERARAKVRGAVPRELGERMRDLPAFITRRRGAQAALLGEVLRAVDAQQVLRLNYRDESGAATVRDVWPLGALFGAQAWTLVAWCELRKDFRTFRLDRIAVLAESGRTYAATAGRRLSDFFDDMGSRYGIPPSDFDPER
jgi:predicted DNA-binding transcriptional regulator YafY